MRRALILGGSGQLGQPLLERLHADGWQVLALSRQAQVDGPGLRWLRGALQDLPPDAGLGGAAALDAVVSCGPLDHFSHWYAGSALHAPRVLAFGSTSVEVKRDSADPEERDVASRLDAAEELLRAAAASRGAALTILRPTLVYGAGSDRSLSRIVSLARRWGRFVLPADALGLRQPVHVADLAAAACAALDSVASHGRTYALAGGERLPYHLMVARVLGTLDPPAPLHLVPAPLFRLLLAGAHGVGQARGLGTAAVRRMRDDLVFDTAPAVRDFGYAPRPFQPQAGMFDRTPR